MKRHSESGQGLVEYGMIIGLVSLAAVGALMALSLGTLNLHLGNLAALMNSL